MEPELDDSLCVEETIGNRLELVGAIGSAEVSNVSVGSVRAVRSYRVKRVKIMMPWSLECYSSKAERELYTNKMRARRRRCKMIVPRFGLT